MYITDFFPDFYWLIDGGGGGGGSDIVIKLFIIDFLPV